jgi:hypothetical protein
MKSLKILLAGYITIILLLFLYSFTQIDLSLTFSRIEFLRNLVKSFQYIGYFNRPLSASIYILILMALYMFYFLFLFFVSKKALSKKYIWKVVLVAVAILAFSYNAFSYDLFNYIFDAKILTHYHQNPYLQKALDYPGDPMLSFMHWTHRVFPYGPLWLVLTVPLSFIGFQFFLPTFFLFKLLMAGSFLGSVYFVGKIFQKIAPEKEQFALVFFALNPLLLIESLVSAHLDIVMIFFCLWAFYLLVSKKYISSYTFFLVSVGIKFATGFLLPVFLLITFFQQKGKKLSWQYVFGSSILLMLLSVVAATVRTNFQPWYLVLVLSFAVFLADRYIVFLPTMILSFAALLLYVPYLYLGNWDKPVPQILFTIQIVAIVLSCISVGVYYAYLLGRKNVRLKAQKPKLQFNVKS